MYYLSKKITQNTFFLFIGQIFVLGLNTITVVLLARYLGEYLFGVFSYGLVFVGFFAILSDFGMKPILVREITRNREKADILVNNALCTKIILSVFSIILVYISTLILFQDIQIKMAVIVLSFTIFFSSKVGTVRIALESIFHADMEMKYPVVFQLLDGILQVLFIFILIVLHAHFGIILVGYVLANIPGLILTVFYFIKKIKFKISLDTDQIKWLIKESLPLFIYLLLAMIYERLDVLFLKSLKGEAQVGIYSSAFRLTAPLIFIPYAITTALYPTMSKMHSNKEVMMSRLFSMGFKTLLLVGMIIGTMGTLIGKPIFIFLYGDRFLEAVIPFQLLLWSQSLMFLIFFMVDFNNAQNRQIKNTIYIIIMLIISFFLQRLFILRYGVTGAGWAKIVLNALGLIVLFIISFKYLHFKSYFYKIFTILSIFLFIACTSFIWTMNYWIKLIVFCASMLLCLSWLFSDEEKTLLKRTILSFFLKPYPIS